MGIKDLTKLLKDNNISYVHSSHPRKLEGSKVSIDTAYFLCSRYKAALAHIADASSVDDASIINFILEEGNKICNLCNTPVDDIKSIIPIIFDLDEVKKYWYHLVNLYILGTMKCGISLIWVLDGVSPEAKKGEHVKRSMSQGKQKDRSYDSIRTFIDMLKIHMEASGDNDVIPKELKNMLVDIRSQIGYSMLPSSSNFEEMIDYLVNLGQTIYQAQSEGESTCAKLVLDGIADYPFTKDTDVLLFGCKKVIIKMSFAKGKEIVEYIVLKDILKGLNIDLLQFIDLCILLGCDYNSGIEGIGSKIALDIIKKYGSLIDASNNTKDNKLLVKWGKGTKSVPFDISTLNIEECYKEFVLPDKKLTKPKVGTSTEDISRFNTVPVNLSIIRSLLIE